MPPYALQDYSVHGTVAPSLLEKSVMLVPDTLLPLGTELLLCIIVLLTVREKEPAF